MWNGIISGGTLEVVHIPYRPESDNLLYTNPAGKGPDASVVYAWQVADRYYPNERELPVRGYPYVVRAVPVNPRLEGSGPKAWFISGRLVGVLGKVCVSGAAELAVTLEALRNARADFAFTHVCGEMWIEIRPEPPHR